LGHPGRIWYRVLTGKLTPETTFLSFAVTVAGELYPHTPRVQHIVAGAPGWDSPDATPQSVTRSRCRTE
jgi:hypothetical protein